MTQADFWTTVRRALRAFNEAQDEAQKQRAYQMILRATEKYDPQTDTHTTEPFGSRAILS